MKAFLEEYGLIIVVVAVILILLGIATFLGEPIKNALVSSVNELLETAGSAIEVAPGE